MEEYKQVLEKVRAAAAGQPTPEQTVKAAIEKAVDALVAAAGKSKAAAPVTSKGRHTPGPWSSCGGPNGCACGAVTDTKDYTTVATVRTDRIDDYPAPKSEEYAANMRLIAAAPEMLDLLQSVDLGSDWMRRKAALLEKIAGPTDEPEDDLVVAAQSHG